MNAAGGSFGDEQDVRDRHWHIQPGDIVIDVGANEGSYVLPAIRDKAEKVYAFNPGLSDADMLMMNLHLNPGFAERCEIVRLAVGGEPGWFDWSTSRLVKDKEPHFIEAVTLDGWAEGRELPRVDWIKIDVEGAEVEVLRGAEQLIRRCKPKLLVENHQFLNPTLEKQVVDLVLGWDLGYEVVTNQWHSVTHSFFWRP